MAAEVSEPASARAVAGRRDAGGQVTAQADAGYIRGGSGISIPSRRVVSVAVACVLAGLGVLAVVLALGARAENRHAATLLRSGVPVQVTVTSCFGRATGTGVTVNGFVCRGSFALDGHRHDEVIGGSTALYRPGALVSAVVEPAHPASLSASRSLDPSRSRWTPYVVPLIVLGLFLAGVALALRRARRL